LKRGVTLSLILAIAWLSPTLAVEIPQSVLTPQAQEDLNLRQDIQLLNLVNGLYLTPEQMQALIREIQVADRLRTEHQARMQRYQQAADPVLQELRKTLMSGQKPSDDLSRRVNQVQAPLHREREQYDKKIALLVDDITQILNENQIELIRDYRPCLIPPYSPNASPIGQSADDLGPAVRMLERIRGLPEWLWESRKEQALGRVEEYALYRERVELTAEMKQRIMEAMEQARTLSDVEWEGQKTLLARQVQPAIMPNRAPKGDLMLDRKIAEFLLNPRLAPILQARLAQGAQTAQAQ
jgi:hypothetical protein